MVRPPAHETGWSTAVSPQFGCRSLSIRHRRVPLRVDSELIRGSERRRYAVVVCAVSGHVLRRGLKFWSVLQQSADFGNRRATRHVRTSTSPGAKMGDVCILPARNGPPVVSSATANVGEQAAVALPRRRERATPNDQAPGTRDSSAVTRTLASIIIAMGFTLSWKGRQDASLRCVEQA